MGAPWVAGGRDFGVIFVCVCGKKFKAPDNTTPTGHSCPQCGGPLRPHETTRRVDVKVLLEQKKALRDELRTRDRQLRIAHAEISRLKLENEGLRNEVNRARGGVPFVTIAEAPVVVDRSAEWHPLELPSERLDLSTPPAFEEIPDLAHEPKLPSDRVPL
jgi:hypothetical protein